LVRERQLRLPAAVPTFVVVDVLTRAITGSPIAGVFEFSRLLLLTATCLAWPAVEYYGKHLRVDILITNMSEARQAACRLAERVMTFVAFAIITGMAGHEWMKAYVGGSDNRGRSRFQPWYPRDRRPGQHGSLPDHRPGDRPTAPARAVLRDLADVPAKAASMSATTVSLLAAGLVLVPALILGVNIGVALMIAGVLGSIVFTAAGSRALRHPCYRQSTSPAPIR